MKMKKLLLVFTALFFQGCSVFGIRTVELLDYTLIEKDGNFDIRQYQDYWVAHTGVEGEYKKSTSEAFGRLFRYISGNNSQQMKISMTGPVIQQRKGEEIAMTGPVIQQKIGTQWVMEFVLPSKYNESSPPQPLDSDVRVFKKTGYKAAALRFSGNLSEGKFSDKKLELLDLVDQKNLQPIGEPFSAGYDPPWTLPFLKRNEVLVVVE
jgi:hypothetical protein